MPKNIKVVVQVELKLPSNAEVIRFRDEEGVESDHIKFMGKLFRPNIGWMEYLPSHVTKKKFKDSHAGISWETIDSDLYNEHFCEPEDWYMEEL